MAQKQGNTIILDKGGLHKLSPALKRHLLRAAIEELLGNLKDIEALLKLEQFGVTGVIIGKALYSGGIQLKDALALSSGEMSSESSGTP